MVGETEEKENMVERGAGSRRGRGPTVGPGSLCELLSEEQAGPARYRRRTRGAAGGTGRGGCPGRLLEAPAAGAGLEFEKDLKQGPR